MRLASLWVAGRPVLALREGGAYYDLTAADPGLGSDLGEALATGPGWRQRALAAAERARPIEPGALRFRPLVPRPGKVLCVGLNDVDHAAEAGLPIPEFPVVFGRFASSLIGHGEPLLRPAESAMLDYEVELAVVIARRARRVPESRALECVAGYTVFNDGSVRDVQVRTAQWMPGKNYHGTGALGPDLVTPDELPAGAAGLRMTTRVGEELLQDGDTGRMIFGVARIVAELSTIMLLEPGDVIAMGTPSGIGFARKPQRFLEPGEVCRVAIERIGALHNPVVDDAASTIDVSATHPKTPETVGVAL